jgi:S1-C subfamily serine protease
VGSSKLVLISALLLAIAIPGEAQQPRSGERSRPSATVIPERELYKVFAGNRGKIGITLNILPGPMDSIGALVDAVTPAGPADRAGIRSGDIIVTMNNRSLVQLARENRKPSPGLVLIELVTQKDAGDTVRLEYQRGRDRRQATVVLEARPVLMWDQPAMAPGYKSAQPMDGPEGPDFFFNFDAQPMFDPNTPGGSVMLLRTRVMDLELAPMNPALGQYFGVAEGVLVINVPEDTQLNLRPGDVVLSVDGRKTSNPGQMFRVLQSYEPGENIRFEVMRMKRREVVTGRIGPTP